MSSIQNSQHLFTNRLCFLASGASQSCARKLAICKLAICAKQKKDAMYRTDCCALLRIGRPTAGLGVVGCGLRACSHRQFFFQVRVDVLHYIPMIQSVFVKKILGALKTPLPAVFFHCSVWFSSWEKFNSPRKSTRRQAVF